jgi:predicted DNA binding CopG/RHH family protein
MTQTKKRRIPAFTSTAEEAAFWDTHSTADYEEEFHPVTVRFSKNLSRAVAIRLDPDTLEAIRKQAYDKGIGPTTLMRMWIMERIQAEQCRQQTP